MGQIPVILITDPEMIKQLNNFTDHQVELAILILATCSVIVHAHPDSEGYIANNNYTLSLS